MYWDNQSGNHLTVITTSHDVRKFGYSALQQLGCRAEKNQTCPQQSVTAHAEVNKLGSPRRITDSDEKTIVQLYFLHHNLHLEIGFMLK